MSKQDIAPITGHLVPASGPIPSNSARGDGWTLPKQAAFLRALSAIHSVSHAAKSVSMSRQSAYRLRSRLKGKAFDLAWEVAFHHSYDVLAHAALDRAINGTERPIFFQGEQVGSYRKYDERLTVAMLNRLTPRGNPKSGRLGPSAERHARDFEGLLGAVEAGEAVDTGAPQFDEPSEREHLEAREAGYSGFAKEMQAHAERLEAEAYREGDYAEEGWPYDEEAYEDDYEEGCEESCEAADDLDEDGALGGAPDHEGSEMEAGDNREGDKEGVIPPCPSTLSHEQVLKLLQQFDDDVAGIDKGDRV